MNRELLIDRLRTVVAVTVTPFNDARKIDEAAYRKVLRGMLDSGITAVTPNGNTGEFYALDIPETERMVELTIEEADDSVLVLPGVGHDAETAGRMAKFAALAGAEAVMVHHPVAPYLSIDGWIDYHRTVAASAPDVGLVAYVREPKIDGTAIARLLHDVPNLVGVKYAIPDPFTLVKAIETVGSDSIAWICGLAERWAPFHWLAGVQGFTSGLANIAPAASIELFQHLSAERMNQAMKVWSLVIPMEDLRARNGGAYNVSALKEALSYLSIASRSVRAPASELPELDRSAVAKLIDDWRRAGILGKRTA